MQLFVNERELDVLVDVLRSAMGDLREEIYKTESAPYEAQLKSREVILTGLVDRLSDAQASGLSVGEPESRR